MPASFIQRARYGWCPNLRINRYFSQERYSLSILLLILGIVLHWGLPWDLSGGWLAWQPLWADEGYSVYFATETLQRILWLTAHDIHPPLYYLFLHGWIERGATADPVALRLFSVLLAAPVLWLGFALARLCFPGRRRPQLLFLLLLIVNPLYLYYSQEVRMYGLALTLSMASTLCCWQWVLHRKAGKVGLGWLALYILTVTLSLYTLYYLAFLLLAQLIWTGWALRTYRPSLLHLLLAVGLIGLLFLPWVVYTARILIAYINDKIRSDQDVALGIGAYLTRHLLAFTGGHLPFPTPLTALTWLALLVVSGLLLWSVWGLWTGRETISSPMQRALGLFCALPVLIGFGVNRFYPFFPVGGERLLLFVLPYFLLIVTSAIDDLWQKWRIGPIALLLLVLTSSVGIWVFYTLPRYQSDDYRPLIRQMVQEGSDADTVLATFPWQVGLWRAYAPTAGLTPTAGPTLQLLSDRSVLWGPAVTRQIDAALARGMLWIPSLRSIGSTLPAAMDTYLTGRAVNFVQQWASPTTRLDAWHGLATIPSAPIMLDWGDIQLVNAGVATTTLPAANYPLVIALDWQTPATLPAVGVTLRLQRDGQPWAQRDYAPLGTLVTQQTNALRQEQVGLIVPVGLPPGDYTLVIGLVGADNALRPLHSAVAGNRYLAPLTTLTITPPTAPLPAFRLPMQQRLAQPAPQAGVALLGYSGSDTTVLAGTLLDLTLFWQSQATTLADQQLYVSLLDDHGAGVAGWEGWPLPTYPLSQWSAGALVQTPVSVLIPATVASGTYRLVAGLLDPRNGTKQPPVTLGVTAIHQRAAVFTPTPPPITLEPPAQFGTHAQLLGYNLQKQDDQILLDLYWQVLQPILPAHHLFVHLDNAAGATLGQADSEPQTRAGLAPTGSWQPGEFLVTHHRLTSIDITDSTVVLRVGLYEPEREVRLPLSLAGTPAGDALVIDLNR